MILKITDNFDLQKIIDSGQCFRAKRIDDKFLFINKNDVLYIKEVGKDSYEANWTNEWKEYFDLKRNYKDIRAKDKFMRKAKDYSRGIRILKQDPFETLISFIISQRKTIPAIKSSIEKICLKYGDKITDNIYSFPKPEKLANASLDDCGLGYRIDYVRETCQQVLEEGLNLENLPTKDLIEKLKGFYGVGEKVANCVALFAYGRVECAPVDTWIKKIIDKYYNGKNPFIGKNAGILQQYAFYYIQNHKI